MRPVAAAFLASFLAAPACLRAQADSLQEKRAVLELLQRHYLWPASLPEAVAVEDFATTGALLRHLTARAEAEGRDPGWTRLVAPEAGSRVFGCEFDLGYGAQFLAEGSRVFVAQVLRDSGAARAGFTRGDEVLAVAATRAELDAPASQVAALLARDTWWQALGPESTWTSRRFRLQRAGAILDVKATMAMSRLEPVPEVHAPRLLEIAGRKVGYLHIRGFGPWTEAPLRQVLAHYRTAGVSDLILDVRYNPGGTDASVQALLNLLRAGARREEVMFKVQGRAPEAPGVVHFQADPGALRLERIAFITTPASGSATELAINSLLPWFGRNLALIGGRTYGKPVGLLTLPVPGSERALQLATCRYLNALDEGDYDQGLPGASFRGSTCLAADDLDHAQGDPAEASTAAALAWIAGRTEAQRPIPGPPAQSRPSG